MSLSFGTAIATLPLYRFEVNVLGWLMSPEIHTEGMWYGFNLIRYVLCLGIMLPATFCAGMTLPLITHVLLRRGLAEGVIGRVYGFNTLGAIAGAVAAGLVLLPLIGVKNVIVAGAVIDLVLGLLLLREVAAGPDEVEVRQTSAWHSSTPSQPSLGSARPAPSRASTCQPRWRPWSTLETSAGHQVLA